MGLNISPAVVQAFIDSVFRVPYTGPGPMHGKIALGNIVCIYMDDMCVHSCDEYHADILEWCFMRLAKANVQVKLTKTFVGKESVALLGHNIDKDGLHMDPNKIKAISKMPPPVNPEGIKRFLGMAGYYRTFVKGFGQKVFLLTELTKKNTPWEWTAAHQAEFEDIKQCLTSAPILMLPRFNEPFTIRTDASDTGMGVVLTQMLDGVRRIVACASRKWTIHEINWDTRRKECFACLYGCRKFAEYLQGTHFTLETDHKNMLWIMNVGHETSPQLYRWAQEFSTLNFEIKHVSGCSLADADCLSRAPLVNVHDIHATNTWEGYQIRVVHDSTLSPTFAVMLSNADVGTDLMATTHTPFKVVAISTTDTPCRLHLNKRTGLKVLRNSQFTAVA